MSRAAIYQWMGPDVDTSGPGIDLSNQNYLDLLRWKPVLATSLLPSGINVTDSNATSVGWIVVYNDVRSSVEALISHADVTADSVSVVADLAALIRSTADISGVSSGGNSLNNGGTSLALGFVIATNVILSKVLATIESSRVTTRSGSMVVRAGNVSQIDAEALNSIESAGEGAGVTLAFNSIGWNSQNILFNLIDTILGDPLIAGAFGNANPAEATALVHNSTLTAGADVDVSAITEATINATVSNKATTTVVVITGSTALAVGVAIASNMVNSTASATIEFDTPDAGDATLVEAASREDLRVDRGRPARPTGRSATTPPIPNYRLVSSVTAGGSVTVHAEDAAGIFATVEVISIATAESTVRPRPRRQPRRRRPDRLPVHDLLRHPVRQARRAAAGRRRQGVPVQPRRPRHLRPGRHRPDHDPDQQPLALEARQPALVDLRRSERPRAHQPQLGRRHRRLRPRLSQRRARRRVRVDHQHDDRRRR